MPVSVIPDSVIPDSTLARYTQFRYTRFPLAVLRRNPTHLQSPVEGFWYGDTGGLSRAVGRDRRDESVQLVPKEGGKFIFSFPRIIISETSNS